MASKSSKANQSTRSTQQPPGGPPGRRTAIVAGVRTPFAKSGTVYKDLTALDLAKVAVRELLERSELDPGEIDQVIYGQVVPSLQAPNIAREVVLALALPKRVEAFSVSRACATSIQALTSAADAIAAGTIDCAIVGGAESLSDVPIAVSKPMAQALVEAQRGKTPLDKLRPFTRLRARDLVPVPPAIAEYSTGETMGEAAEKMAKLNGISREEQDLIAHASHSRAARAYAEGKLQKELATVHLPPAYEQAVAEDTLVRKDSKLEAYAQLKPVFDRKHGSVTAGNSSPLTDGASALLVMSEEKAKALGYTPIGYLRSYAYAGVDPSWQLLMGPAFAAPKALDRARLSLADMGLIEMHEAFAAQVASNIQALESKSFAEEHLGRSAPVGRIDRERLNVNGGSIALGHPFAATGARLVTQLCHEMQRRQVAHGLITVCAAGGLGAAVVIDRE